MKDKKQEKIEIDESLLTPEQLEEIHRKHFPLGWFIFVGVLLILLIVCIILIVVLWNYFHKKYFSYFNSMKIIENNTM